MTVGAKPNRTLGWGIGTLIPSQPIMPHRKIPGCTQCPQLKGRGNENYRRNSFIASAFQNGLVSFRPATPEFMKLQCVYRGGSLYRANYLRIYWTNLHQIFRLGRYMGLND